MPFCLCVCLSVCLSAKISENASSRVTKAFKMTYSMKNNQQNHIGMFLYLIQVKAVLVIISATSYHRFLGSTLFKIARGTCGQYAESIWPDIRRGVQGEYSMNTL